MSVSLIFKIAAVGILVTILNQVLKHSGREDHAFLISLAGLILVLTWIVPYIYDLFVMMQELFDEIWSDIILQGNHHIPLQMISDDARNRTISLYAPSKTFNLAGLIGAYHIIYNQYLRERVEPPPSPPATDFFVHSASHAPQNRNAHRQTDRPSFFAPYCKPQTVPPSGHLFVS